MNGKSRITGFLLLVFTPLAVHGAQAPRPLHHVERAASEITVDGVLDEAAWQKAAKIELKYETRPGENTPPAVATEAFVTYDAGHLYVAFRAHDPNPSAIRAHVSDRDSAFNDDFVGIVLDTFNDQRRAFEFFVNPLGVQMDLFMDDVSGNEDSTWDAIWNAAGRIDEDGYTVEIAIPFSSLRFPRTEGEQTWGVDVLRFYPRSQRARISDHPLDRNVNCYLCQNSKIAGFAGITPGRNLELTPTVTATRTDKRQDFPSGPLREGGVKTEPGLTAKWGVTPNLTLNATLNPDFSQVEADAAQLNVNTQFALFFPEKRPFFLEGADFFSTPFNVVFTRNVAAPSWGVKLTGKEEKNAIGVFAAQDDRTNLLFPGNSGSSSTSLGFQTTDAVLRYRRDFGSSSAVGVLFTDRQGDGYMNHLAGIDGLYRMTDSDHVRLQFLRSQTGYPHEVATQFGQPQGTFADSAYQIAYNHDTRDWFAFARYEDVGRDFRADMGFLPRVDYTFLQAGGGHVWNGNLRGFTRASLSSDWDRREDQRGQRLEELVEVTADCNGPLQTFTTLNVARRNRFFNGLTFKDTFSTLYSEMQPSGNLFLSLSLNYGGEIDFVNTRAGDLVQVSPTVRFDLGRHLRTQLSHVYQRLDVRGGELFTANLTQLSGVYQLNVRTFLRATFQYTDVQRNPALYLAAVDERTEALFSQFLFSYKLNPQTVLFLGYSDTSAADQRIDLTRTDRTFFLKLGYAWVP
ncbi:MAG TPA: DUF5916 domain-containing protein [Thermoanaerobaculia bacterium]|jgi:hypothetical protein|nr:DUF5916 domain-containing protein [Thermoanaerobaculia bacterium]